MLVETLFDTMSSYMTELYFGNLALVKYTISFLTLISVAFHAYTKGIWLHFKSDWQYWEGKNTHAKQRLS